MKNTITGLFLLGSIFTVFLVSSCKTNSLSKSKNITTIDSSSYQLIWFDEFEKEGTFNDKKWSYAPRGKVAWNKYMTHTMDYVFQKNGDLVLRMDNAKINGDDVPFHSGGIQSMGKFNIRYGKVEVRAKFTQGKGSWPAIWMMPEPSYSLGGWPAGGEIDIMEHVNNENVVHQTIHSSAVTDAEGGSSASQKTAYKTDDYNTYSIIWKPEYIEFYVNGNLQYTYRKTHDATNKEWPFSVPFYIILNQAGGAGWPGAITDSDLPFAMEVDYVRVYNLPLKELAKIEPLQPIKKKQETKVQKRKLNNKPGKLANPGFESSELYPWTVWGNSTVSETHVNKGNFAVQSIGGETAIEQLITGLKPNTTYTFGGFAKVGALGEKAMMGVKNYGGLPVNAMVNSLEFANIFVSFTTGKTETSAVVYFYKENGGSAFADDFYFMKK